MKRKNVRSRGKFSFSRYFQRLKKGDNVAVDIERSQEVRFPKRLQGRTGSVESSRGAFAIVKIKDQNKEKEFVIHPIHLKKIQ